MIGDDARILNREKIRVRRNLHGLAEGLVAYDAYEAVAQEGVRLLKGLGTRQRSNAESFVDQTVEKPLGFQERLPGLHVVTSLATSTIVISPPRDAQRMQARSQELNFDNRVYTP